MGNHEFITDCDIGFTSAFWKGVTELLGTRIVMSSLFHPQTDGQTERVNQIKRRTCDIMSLLSLMIGYSVVTCRVCP
jgi:hypothetical protein